LKKAERREKRRVYTESTEDAEFAEKKGKSSRVRE
jgi:hypothetical protein